MHKTFWSEFLHKRYGMGSLGLDGRMTVKWMSRLDGALRTRLLCVSARFREGVLRTE